MSKADILLDLPRLVQRCSLQIVTETSFAFHSSLTRSLRTPTNNCTLQLCLSSCDKEIHISSSRRLSSTWSLLLIYLLCPSLSSPSQVLAPNYGYRGDTYGHGANRYRCFQIYLLDGREMQPTVIPKYRTLSPGCYCPLPAKHVDDNSV